MTKEASEDGAAMESWVKSQIALAVAPLEKMLYEQQAASAKALDKIGRMKGRVDAIDPGTVAKTLGLLNRDAKEIHARMQLQIFQMTVATEVSYFAGLENRGDAHLLRFRVIEAMDFPASWWAKRKELTIGGWYAALAAADYRPEPELMDADERPSGKRLAMTADEEGEGEDD